VNGCEIRARFVRDWCEKLENSRVYGCEIFLRGEGIQTSPAIEPRARFVRDSGGLRDSGELCEIRARFEKRPNFGCEIRARFVRDSCEIQGLVAEIIRFSVRDSCECEIRARFVRDSCEIKGAGSENVMIPVVWGNARISRGLGGCVRERFPI
jgi:hypothetical protein